MKQAAPAGDLVRHLLQGLGCEEKIRRYRAWQVWDEVVGPQIACHAQPVRLRGAVLEVRVDQPVWMQQLQLMKPQILTRLNEQLGETEIHDIYWRRGRLTSGPDRPETGGPGLSLDGITLPESELRDIEKNLAGIADPDLRTRLRRILHQQARLEKARKTASSGSEKGRD